MTAVSSSQSPPHIPLDLVSEVLCRLPVKQLLHLCCVCKSWNSLISLDSNFARKQLSLSTSNKDRHHLILFSTQSSRELLLCHSPISFFFTPASIKSELPVNQVKHNLTVLLNTEQRRVEISTCDGILCFAIDESLAVLYNPFIRKSKILPPLKTSFPNLYTLVYHRIITNYKVIAIALSDDSKKQVNIHTLGTDYWTRIQDFPRPNDIIKPGTGIFVNDTVNWFTWDTSLPQVTAIVSLDLEKESYQMLSAPSFGDDTGSELSVSLGALRGCLSIVSHSRTDKCSNVWVMKEYGNEKSWTKLFTVPCSKRRSFYCHTKVLYISEDDQLLMEFFKKGIIKHGLVVYDSINKTSSIPKMRNSIHDLKVAPHFYVESLISPF